MSWRRKDEGMTEEELEREGGDEGNGVRTAMPLRMYV
jgi:hypothetical protein